MDEDRPGATPAGQTKEREHDERNQAQLDLLRTAYAKRQHAAHIQEMLRRTHHGEQPDSPPGDDEPSR